VYVGVYTKSKSSELSSLRRKLLRNFLLRCARIKSFSAAVIKFVHRNCSSQLLVLLLKPAPAPLDLGLSTEIVTL
jgi:hypothetical protein